MKVWFHMPGERAADRVQAALLELPEVVEVVAFVDANCIGVPQVVGHMSMTAFEVDVSTVKAKAGLVFPFWITRVEQ